MIHGLAELPTEGLSLDLSHLFTLKGVRLRLYATGHSQTDESWHLPFASKSHSRGLTVVLQSNHPCGVDLESLDSEIEPWLFADQRFQDFVLAPGEAQAIKASKYAEHGFLATVVWSSKEALAKALGDARKYSPSRLRSPISWESEPVQNWEAEFIEIEFADHSRFCIWVVLRAEMANN